MKKDLYEEQITVFGFRKLAPVAFVSAADRLVTPKEQWQYNNVILAVYEEDGKLYYRFFDKTTPEFTLAFKIIGSLSRYCTFLRREKQLMIYGCWSRT